MTNSWRHDPDEVLVGFTRALRAAGVPVAIVRTQTFLSAVALVGIADLRATYWAGRATLCSGPEELARYDQVFGKWFLTGDPGGTLSAAEHHAGPEGRAALSDDDGVDDDDFTREAEFRAMASAADVLRHRDIAELGPAERARLAALFGSLQPRLPRRAARRRTPSRGGDLDPSRTMRAVRAGMGEPGELAWRRRASRERRLVLLIDVSGSMSAYADALMRLAHRYAHAAEAGGRVVEVFTVGTRLTHVTRAMGIHDPDRAIAAVGSTVPDWSGGTRLGEVLKVFLDRWGRRGMARGAVVVVFSDGWERGDADLLGAQMRRLRGFARRVVWVNPHKGKEGYLPLQQGIVAALPFVDDFVSGHSIAAFEELVEVVARA